MTIGDGRVVACETGVTRVPAVRSEPERESAAVDVSLAWPSDVLACLDAISIPLERKGFEPLTPWWQATIERFYRAQQRTLIARVGRRGRKSSTWCRVAVAEILSARHRVPPGDTGVVAIVSVDLREAVERIRTIAAILDALGIEHEKPTQKGIDFKDRPYRVSVFTASIAGVSGFTCIFALGDEVAKWREGETRVNPAAQVIASWRPTMLTMPGSKMVLLSSPMGFEDAHAMAFDQGDTASQLVAFAPTWIASPLATEAECRSLATSEAHFRREYGAVPQSGDDDDKSPITDAQLDRATRKRWTAREPNVEYVAGIYPCPRTAMWVFMVVGRRRGKGGEVRTAVARTRAWPASDDARKVIAGLRKELQAYDLTWARTPLDAFSAETRRIAARYEIGIVVDDVTADMHDSLRMRFASDGVELTSDPLVRADLLAQRKRVGPTSTTFEARRFSVLLALLAAKALVGPPERIVRPIPGSPEYWQELARKEELADYAAMRDRNATRDTDGQGEDWIGEMRRQAEGATD